MMSEQISAEKIDDATPVPTAIANDAVKRLDGWLNLITGIGVSSRDKRLNTKFCAEPVTQVDAEELWRGDDLAARIIETMPNEMVREGAELTITAKRGDKSFDSDRAKQFSEDVQARWDDLGMWTAIHEALCYERAYGGAAILLGANDGGDITEPLDIAKVKKFDFLTTLMPSEITPVEWYGDPQAKSFGRPSHYQLSPESPGSTGTNAPKETLIGKRVHESRVIMFDGIRVSRRALRGTINGHGDSVLTRVNTVLRDFNLSWSAAGILVVDFSQAVYKMKGLVEAVQQDIAEGKTPDFTARMIAMELGRSVARATLIDGEDEFKRETTNLAGLPDLLDRFATRLSASADLPLALLFGESPGGLNASGASGDQLRMFYDRVKSQQKRKLGPIIRRITRLIMMTMGGEPAQWSLKWCSLWQPTDKEQAETRNIQADTDVKYIDAQVISPEDVQRSRFGGDEYSSHTSIERIEAEEETEPGAEDVAAYKAAVGAPAGAPTIGAKPAPGAATAGAAPGGSTEIQQQALNGAQVTSMVEVVKAINAGEISRESGIAMLEIAFQLSAETAARLAGPVGFKPREPAPAPAPFGGGPSRFAPKPDLDPKAEAAAADKPQDKTVEETKI